MTPNKNGDGYDDITGPRGTFPRSDWAFRWCTVPSPFNGSGPTLDIVAVDVTGGDNPGDYSAMFPVASIVMNAFHVATSTTQYMRVGIVGPGHDDSRIGKRVQDPNIRECLFGHVWFKIPESDDWCPGRCTMVHLDERGEIRFVVMCLDAEGVSYEVGRLSGHHVKPMAVPTF